MRLLHSLFAASLLAFAQFGAAQSYPDKPIQLIVGFPPGGGVDIVARQLAEKLSEQLGQRVVVENKAGAAGNVAMEYVARAKPDGYTLLMGNLGMLTANPSLYPKLPFDPGQDFAPIARVVVTPLVAVVPASLQVQDMTQFLALARAKPGELNFGSGGNGNINHLAGELLKLQTDDADAARAVQGQRACIGRPRRRPHPADDRRRQRRAAVRQGRPRPRAHGDRRGTLARAAGRADVEGGRPAAVRHLRLAGRAGADRHAAGDRRPPRRGNRRRRSLRPTSRTACRRRAPSPRTCRRSSFAPTFRRELKRWTGVIRTAKITID